MTNSQNGKSRKELEEEFRRGLVLDAAELLFAETGFDGATVSEIAERSELAKGSLYQIFKSKQEIIDAIVDRKVQDMKSTLAGIFSLQIGPSEKLFKVMEAKLRGIWRNRGFARLFISEFHGFNWYMETRSFESCRSTVKDMLVSLETLVIDAQKAGEIRDDIPLTMVLASIGGISNAVIHLWLRSDPDTDINIEDAVKQARGIFLNGVRPVAGGSNE